MACRPFAPVALTNRCTRIYEGCSRVHNAYREAFFLNLKNENSDQTLVVKEVLRAEFSQLCIVFHLFTFLHVDKESS